MRFAEFARSPEALKIHASAVERKRAKRIAADHQLIELQQTSRTTVAEFDRIDGEKAESKNASSRR